MPFAGFVVRRVLTSLKDLAWTHALTAGTITMTLFVFGVFLLLQVNLEQLLKGWGEQVQVTAYLAKGVGSNEVQGLIARVQSFPEVARIEHITHEQAYRDFQTALGTHSGLLEGLPRDVLPSSIEVLLKPSERDSSTVEQLAQRLRSEKEVESVEYPQAWIDRLNLIVLALQWAKWVIAGLLFVVTFFIVGSTIKLATLARREEIEIMQLIGASEELIQAPFVVEGMIQGIVGGALSLAALWVAYILVRNEVPIFAGVWSTLGPFQFLDPKGIVLIVAMGWFLGAVGSLVSLRRFLRTWKASGGDR